MRLQNIYFLTQAACSVSQPILPSVRSSVCQFISPAACSKNNYLVAAVTAASVCVFVCACVVRVFVPIISCSCLLIKCVKRRHLISFSYLQRSDMAYTQRTDQAFISLSLSPSLSITAGNQLKPLASRCVALAH